jgi:hypothetical protein
VKRRSFFWIAMAGLLAQLAPPARCEAGANEPALAAPPGAETNGLSARRSQQQLRESGFEPLIENNSLERWDVRPWHEGHWVLTGGVIHYDGKAAHRQSRLNSLWTVEEFGDLQLYCEWRLPREPHIKPHPIVLFNGDFLLDDAGRRVTRSRLDAGDSGLLFRGSEKCQANIWSQELGSGEINGYRTDRAMPPEVRRAAIPIKNADRKAGEWNVFLITLEGELMSVELNGERVIDRARLPGLPKTGPIGLQHHGDPVEFRKLWVKRLAGN